MTTRLFYVLALLPLLFISEGCAVRTTRGNLTFPFRERDMPRITSFQILCEEGSVCDEKYIQLNLQNLERHFRIVCGMLSPKSPYFLKIHVVPLERMRQIRNEDPSLDEASRMHIPQGIIMRNELYTRGFVPEKNDPALNLALETCIREVYRLTNDAPISHEEFVRIKEEVVARGKNTIDASFLKQ